MSDSYAMALKAMHVDIHRMKLLTTEQIFASYQAAITVFGIQLCLITFIAFCMYES